MRKSQKNQIIESIVTMKKAHVLLADMIDKRRVQESLLLLRQCQESAIIIGTEIEKAEGEGTGAVRCLEEYCELIYFFYERMAGAEFVSAKKVKKDLDRKISQVEESVRNEIKVKAEVLFLPYKASMWDSLESIWKAADADPDCDAYVMPIPYFDKNPDGTAKEMHYEGELFPEYVPITHYDAYDIEGRHPDVIYIHNPYDEANYVTSVHPAFYSKKLKKLTDCLVYVPYFVLGEANPKDMTSVRRVEHFVTVPGVLHADKVFVQSEQMRQIYVDVMTGFTGEDTRPYWEGKLYGTGSPKYDKVYSSINTQVDIPQEWLKIINKPDGRRKKIIFYNTSVSALLNYGDRALEKMQQVFEFFEENSEEIALLWRPHPLIKATVESMRPQLWEKYQAILNDYTERGFGIYDDTPDMDRAIALCDGYFGDASSVVSLCKKAGKPVMIQNFNNEIRNSVLFEDFCLTGNKMIFVARDMNLICKLDLTSGKTEILGQFPNQNKLADRLALKIDMWKEQLIFTPLNADNIETYNVFNHTWSHIEIQEKCEQLRFFQTIIYENSLFLFGALYPSIIKLDLEKQQLTYYDEMFKEMPEEYMMRGSGFFRCDYAKIGDKVYFATCCANMVLEFDLRKCEYRWISVGSEENRYSGIAWDGTYFWLSPRENTPIIRWDGKDEVKEFEFPQSVRLAKKIFLGVCVEEEAVIFPEIESKKTIIIKNGDEERIEISDRGYSCYKVLFDGCRVSQEKEGKVVVVKEGTEKCYDNCLEEKSWEQYLDENRTEIFRELVEEGYKESALLDLQRFCELIQIESYERKSREEKNVGKVIWEQTGALCKD